MELIEREKITIAGGVPTIAWQLIEHPARAKYDLSSLETVTYGGAPSAPELVRKIKAAFPQVRAGNGWGMTETSATFTHHAGRGLRNTAPTAAGRRRRSCDLKIVDKTGRALPVGEVGELWARARTSCRATGTSREATAQTFVDGWVRTGDLARLDEEGFCYIVDRAKDMLIRGGENIYCIEVENVLYEHPAVMDARAGRHPAPDPGRGAGRGGHPEAGRQGHRGRAAAFVAERLAAFKVPVQDRVLARDPAAQRQRQDPEERAEEAVRGPKLRRRVSHGSRLLARGRRLPRRGPRLHRGRTIRPACASKQDEGEELAKEDFLAWHRILAKKGWVAPAWPKEYGGPGWTPVQRYIWSEETGPRRHRADPAVRHQHGRAGDLHLRHGRAESSASCRRRCRATSGGARAIPSRAPGSDLASLKTKATLTGATATIYIVNGQKTWTTLAQHADWIFCLVRTDPDAKPQAGICFLLIDMKTPGITVRPIITLDGEHEVNEVWLENVKVPVENRIFEENKGWTCAKFLLAHERTGIAGVARSKRGVERAARIAAAETEGRTAARCEDPFFTRKIAELEIDLTGAGIHRAAHPGPRSRRQGARAGILAPEDQGHRDPAAPDRTGAGGRRPLRRALLPRLRATRATTPMPIGPDYAHRAAPTYFNVRKTSIYGGSNEIQRNIIAKMVLGPVTCAERIGRHGFQLHRRTVDAARHGRELPRRPLRLRGAGRLRCAPTAAGGPRSGRRFAEELGILGAAFPESAGGLGGGAVENMLHHGGVRASPGGRALSGDRGDRRRLAEALGLDARPTLGWAGIASGEAILAFAAMSRRAATTCSTWRPRARKPATAGCLNGHKAVVLAAPWADHLIVTARTGGGRRDRAGVVAVPGRQDRRRRHHPRLSHRRRPARLGGRLRWRARPRWSAESAAAADRAGARRGHRRGLRRSRRRACAGCTRHARLRPPAQAVRPADRRLPGAAAPHGRHVHGGRAVGVDDLLGHPEARRACAERAKAVSAAKARIGRALAIRRPERHPDPRRHGHDRRAGDRPLLQARHHDRRPVRRRRASPGAIPAGGLTAATRRRSGTSLPSHMSAAPDRASAVAVTSNTKKPGVAPGLRCLLTR